MRAQPSGERSDLCSARFVAVDPRAAPSRLKPRALTLPDEKGAANRAAVAVTHFASA
jgi:hypothetical protein